MTKRRLLLGAGIAWLVLLIGAAAALSPRVREDPISPEGAARIREGMTEEEVKTVLGGQEPAGGCFGGAFGETCVWVSQSGDRLEVDFANRRDVFRVSGQARFVMREPLPLLDRLRRLLPW